MNTHTNKIFTKHTSSQGVLRMCVILVFVATFGLCAPSVVLANTLVDELQSQVDNRISGVATPSSAISLFTTRGAGAGTTWIRNTGIWTNQGADIDWTGIAVWNNSGGYLYGGTLISPRHIVMAAHYPIPNGATVTFVQNDNTVVTRTLSSQTYLGNDITVGILDSAVPSGITHYKLPPTFADFSSRLGLLNSLGDTYTVTDLNIPLVSFDQEKKATVHRFTYFSSTTIEHIHYSTSTSPTRVLFSHPTIPGDSGNPMFALIQNSPVLLSSHYSSTGSTYYGSYLSSINSAMDTLSGSNEYDAEVFLISSYVVSTPGTPDLLSISDTNIVSDNITASTTPSLSVSCYTGATVNLYRDSVAVASGACASSLFTFTSASLSSGQYLFESTQSVGGAVSGTSTALTITVDSSTPSDPVTAPDLVDTSDTGASSTDNYTYDSLPRFSGSCVSGNTVNLYIDSSFSSSILCVDSSFIVQVGSAVSYGVKVIKYNESDTAGNTSGFSPTIVVNFNTESSSLYLNIDGTKDSTFNPGGVGINTGGRINTMTRQQSTGKYIIVGSFTSYNTSSATTTVGRIARLNTDGTLDATFNSGGVGANNEVMFLGFQSDGKIIIQGSFTTYNGTTVGRIARLNTDGTLDTTFNSGGAGFSANPYAVSGSSAGSQMIVDSQNKILFTGTPFGSSYTYNSVSPEHKGLIRINADGTLDTTFNSGGNGPRSVGNVGRILELESGKYLILVSVSTDSYHDAVNGTSTKPFLLRLNTDGTLDTTFNSGGVGFSSAPGANYGMEIYEDLVTNDIYIASGAAFFGYSYNGTPITSTIMSLFADGTLNTQYSNSGILGDALRVNSLTPVGDNKFAVGLSITLASNFGWGTYNLGTSSASVLKFLIVGPNGVDASIGYKQMVGASTLSTYAILESNGKITIAGGFSAYDGITQRGVTRITKSTTPTLVRLVSTTPNGTYKVGDPINISAILSEVAKPSSTMSVTLDTGESVTLSTSATSTSLQGTYIVEEGQSSSDLAVASIDGASVIDTLGTVVTSFSIPSSTLESGSNIVIDGISPTAATPDLIDESDTGISVSDQITKDNTPTFSVVCSVGGTASLYTGSIFVASSTCATSPVEITTTPLSSGTYNFTSIITDLVGNTSATSTPSLVVIVSTSYSGATPSTPDLSTASDTGLSSTDDITSDTTPTFIGSCVTNETVVISIDGLETASITCASSAYSYTSATLDEALHTIVVGFKDVADNESNPSVGLLFTVSSTLGIALVVVSTPNSTPSGSPTAYSYPQSIPTVFTRFTPTDTILTTTNMNVPTGVAFIFTKNISTGLKTNSGVDIKNLQIVLNRYGYVVAQSGAGSPGKETTVFGTQTKKSLSAFQRDQKIPVTGNLDTKTRSALNTLQSRTIDGLKNKMNLSTSTVSSISTMSATPTESVAPQNLCTTAIEINNPIKYGSANNDATDVRLLENFLNMYEGFSLPINGMYEKRDFDAVVQWQEKYASEILTPWGATRGTGYVFTSSLKKIKSIVEDACRAR